MTTLKQSTPGGQELIPRLSDIALCATARAIPGEDLPGAAMSNIELSDLMAVIQERLAQDPEPRHIELSSPTFPEERVGILSRQVLDSELNAQDMAIAVGRRILQGRNDLDSIRIVIVSTVTADRVVPSMASILQSELGLSNHIQGLDLCVGCSGFVVALETAARMLGTYPVGSKALVVGSDAMTRVVDASDRGTCTIFGDGAGAFLLGRLPSGSQEPSWRVRSAETFTMGSRGDAIEIRPTPEISGPVWRFTARDGKPDLFLDEFNRDRVLMQGRAVYKDMVNLVPKQVQSHLDNQGLTPEDIDYWFFHQANMRMLEAIAKRLRIPPGAMPCNIDRYGNTTSGSVPILLDQQLEAGLGQARRLLMVGFGTGYSLGIVLLERPQD
jgi:3-oxoacyl-[acyl-carrier-protein] synthase-3